MTHEELRNHVSYINGFVRAIAMCDRKSTSVVAGAFLIEIDLSNILVSLDQAYKRLGASGNHEFHSVAKVEPSEAQIMLEQEILCSPFGDRSLRKSKVVDEVRREYVIRLIDLVLMGQADTQDRTCFKVCANWVRSNTILRGSFFLFPLEVDCLAIKFLRDVPSS